MLVNNKWITEEIQEEIKRLGDKQKWKHNDPQFMGHSKITSNSKKKVYSDTRLPWEARKISNKWPNLTPKVTGKKKEQTKPKGSKRK